MAALITVQPSLGAEMARAGVEGAYLRSLSTKRMATRCEREFNELASNFKNTFGAEWDAPAKAAAEERRKKAEAAKKKAEGRAKAQADAKAEIELKAEEAAKAEAAKKKAGAR